MKSFLKEVNKTIKRTYAFISAVFIEARDSILGCDSKVEYEIENDDYIKILKRNLLKELKTKVRYNRHLKAWKIRKAAMIKFRSERLKKMKVVSICELAINMMKKRVQKPKFVLRPSPTLNPHSYCQLI